jgi:hypothetical protein
MRIHAIIWLPHVVDKLADKHHVDVREVEQILTGRTQVRRVQRGKISGEDLYSAMGQTISGRYLIVYFIHKIGNNALVISARDMDARERRQYERK